MVRTRLLANVQIHEIDLMTDDWPEGDYDFAWCRWVVSFVDDSALLIQKLGRVMPKGSLSIFHEYGHYATWRFFPRLPMQERFREHVIAAWRESGGEPDGAARLPELLADNGFVIRSARPHVFCLRPDDYMWQWPATFIEIYLTRLIQMGRIDQKFADQVRADLASAERNRNSFMLTPLVLEIIAEKMDWAIQRGRKYMVPLTKSKIARFSGRYSTPIIPATRECDPNISGLKRTTDALPFWIW